LHLTPLHQNRKGTMSGEKNPGTGDSQNKAVITCLSVNIKLCKSNRGLKIVAYRRHTLRMFKGEGVEVCRKVIK